MDKFPPIPRRFDIPKEKRLKAEDALRDWGVDFNWTEEGTILVPGDINIGRYELTEIPDLSFVVVKGYFNCTDNHLTTLKGMPQSVGEGFFCQNNRLTSLEGAPAKVGGAFNCSYNRLTTLKGAPKKIGNGFFCHHNQLTSLEFSPVSEGQNFWCRKNQLASLEHVPPEFKNLTSDFGEFKTWADIPEKLHLSEEKKRQRERELVECATVLKHPVSARKPFQFRKPG